MRPRDVQIKVASLIPLNRWASSTVNSVLAKYPGIDTSQPLGAIQSAAINPSGAPNSTAGGPAAPAATPAPGTTLPGFQPGSPANKLTQAGLKQLAGGDGGAGADEPPKIQPPPMVPGPGGRRRDDDGAGRPEHHGPAARRTGACRAGPTQGFLTQPSLAAFTPGMPQQPMTPRRRGDRHPRPARHDAQFPVSAPDGVDDRGDEPL